MPARGFDYILYTLFSIFTKGFSPGTETARDNLLYFFAKILRKYIRRSILIKLGIWLLLKNNALT